MSGYGVITTYELWVYSPPVVALLGIGASTVCRKVDRQKAESLILAEKRKRDDTANRTSKVLYMGFCKSLPVKALAADPWRGRIPCPPQLKQGVSK